MTEIQIEVRGARAEAHKSGPITTGMVGLPVRFSFSPEWEGLQIIPVFKAGQYRKDNWYAEGKSEVPHEVLQEADTDLFVGAEGRSPAGDLVIPTAWACVGRITSGAKAVGEVSLEPTPSQYDRIMERIDRLESRQDPEAIQLAVDAYMQEHPIEEKDPTVGQWAKEPQKPAYTAQEVGALPESVTIPTDDHINSLIDIKLGVIENGTY